MRKANLITALALSAVVATTGSAFTATSTIDDAAVNVGSVAQSVSGATITNVVHTYDAANDITTALSAKAEQLLSTADGVVTVSLNGTAAKACSVVWTDTATLGVDDGAADYSTVTCSAVNTANVTSVRFVVNG